MELPHLKFPTKTKISADYLQQQQQNQGFGSVLVPQKLSYCRFENYPSVQSQVKTVEEIEKPVPPKIEEKQSEVEVPKRLETEATNQIERKALPDESLKENLDFTKAVLKKKAEKEEVKSNKKIKKRRTTIFDD